jgi:oligopeptide transport system permease protein
VFYCSMLILCTFIVDILYVFIDPRIKLQNAEV